MSAFVLAMLKSTKTQFVHSENGLYAWATGHQCHCSKQREEGFLIKS